ncbi:L-arabinose ABC transporter permease AraH, partial [Burkholderia pseudomallei]|uniref:ABC transporter permease subunit n=1 Tax=Burkholderia pseudomallei TaxID=28450 RepID=UPI00136C3A60
VADGAALGFMNGAVIAYLFFIEAEAGIRKSWTARGLGFIVSKGQAVGVSSDTFIALGGLSLFGISLPIWVTLLCFIVFGVLLNQTVYGRNTLAIGGNPEASRLAGINVERTRVVIFLVQGAVTALAGVILASRITSGQPNAAQGFELNVISACVLGGVSLLGGRATISGVVIGVLIMGTVENVMNLLNIDAFYQYLVRGAILLAAVLLDQLKNRGGRD